MRKGHSSIVAIKTSFPNGGSYRLEGVPRTVVLRQTPLLAVGYPLYIFYSSCRAFCNTSVKIEAGNPWVNDMIMASAKLASLSYSAC